MTPRAPSRAPLSVLSVPLAGVHLIEASAGTGKTFTMTSLVLRLLVESERPIESILAVTFTNAATAELKERVAARISGALSVLRGETPAGSDPVFGALLNWPDRRRALRLLERAERDVDRAGISTIHGFASKMLADHALESGARADAELVGDQRALVLDVVTDFWSKEVATLPEAIFRQMGGTHFFGSLLKVGLVKAGAFDVALVEPSTGLDLTAERERLSEVYQMARSQFADTGRELLELLTKSPALDRNKMRLPSLHNDFEQYVAYFARGEPWLGHPSSVRFTEQKVLSSLKKGKSAPKHPLLPVLGDLKEQFDRVELAAAQFADTLRFRLCAHIELALAKEHERERTQSFDGLLSDLCAALRNAGPESQLARHIRDAYPVALIDEFQDTDPVQYQIFSTIYRHAGSRGGGALFLIGDPKQSIYAFRGADIYTYLRAVDDARAGVWTLATSYRSSPRLVEAQNALFAGPRQPFGLEGIVYDPVEARPGGEDLLLDAAGAPLPGMQILLCDQKDSEFLWIAAQEIANFLDAGHQLAGRRVVPSDIAVLTRTNQQAQQVQAYLRDLSIPAVMHGDRSVFEAPEALELRRILRALSEPGNRRLSRTALATRLIGLTSDQLSALDEDHEALERFMAQLSRWGALFKGRGVAHAIETVFADVDALARTLAQRDGERRMTNFRHLLELLHEAETVEHLGVAGLLRWFEGAIADPSGHAMAAEARQLRLESDADAITLTTAHKSKGLEYNIVFLPTVGATDAHWVDEAFRFYDEASKMCRLEVRGKLTRDQSAHIFDLEAAQESLRLGYVALTRAKHHVVALLGPGRRFSSLGYFVHERALPGEGGLEMALEHLKKVPKGKSEELLTRLQESTEGACSWACVAVGPGPTYPTHATELRLAPPAAPPRLEESEKTSSFSAMTRKNVVSRAAREGRDIDEGTEGGPEPGEDSKGQDAQQRSVLADFPRGARPGDALHAMFEHCTFGASEEHKRQAALRELHKRGFSPEHAEAGASCLVQVLSTPLPSFRAASPVVLENLQPGSYVPEMEFSLPIGVSTGGAQARLSSARLARALGARIRAPHEPPDWQDPDLETKALPFDDSELTLSARYLDAVASLDFDAWSGYLRGFIDLVYEHEGRIYALDYKSNHLGDTYDAYRGPQLLESMEEHHYLLQALLYCVALHRYARARVSNYSYETHFGGMQYLFLRGVAPGKDTGIFWLRPSKMQIDSLDLLFAEPGLVGLASGADPLEARDGDRSRDGSVGEGGSS